MSDTVKNWLNTIDFGHYASLFEANDIDWELLPSVDQDVLKDIGIDSAGHRIRILKAIEHLIIDQGASKPAADNLSSIERQARFSTDEDISSWTRVPGERKPVTLLFVDVVDSTALTGHLDAEEAHNLLYQSTRKMCESVEANAGTVCRFMGDGILAMFGAPIASERHAHEACCAALEMKASIERKSKKLKNGPETGIEIRIGLHSGEVVVLEVGDDPKNPEYDASGPAVAMAARMEQSAKSGTILITHATRDLAADFIEVESRSAISVKGIADPVEVFRLKKITDSTTPKATLNRVPFVGRRVELAQFAGLMDECLKSQRGQTIFVRGDPGIGKTRLVEEMISRAAGLGFACHKVLILNFGVGKGQEAVPALVRSLLGIRQGSGKQSRAQLVDQLENEGVVDTEQRVFLNDLLDLKQPVELRILYDAMGVSARAEGKQKTVSSLLSRIASRQTILIVVEGLHWGDQEILSYLSTLNAVIAQQPAFMLLTSRMEGDPIDSSWRARTSENPIVTWDLGPLRNEDSLQMATSMNDSDGDFVHQCVERAEGNPLFLEQLLLGGVHGDSENVPDLIKSLVLSRLDQLTGQDKLALRAASVLGHRFEIEELHFLMGNASYDSQGLVDHQLIRPEGSQYLFAHALIQAAVYASLLKAHKSELHRKAADWFCERDLVLFAEHLDRAEDGAASNAYLQAAQEQLGLHRAERALQLARRGLEIAPEGERFPLCCLQGELLRYLGDISDSIYAYRLAVEAASGEIGCCQAYIGIALGLESSGAHEDAIGLLDNAEEIAREHNLLLELARIYQIRGGVLFFRGQIDDCLKANKMSLDFARESGSSEVEVQALSGLGNAEYNRGRFISARRYFDKSIGLARLHGFGREIATNLSLRGYVSCWENDLDSALSDYHEAIEKAIITGDLKTEMLTLIIGGPFWAGIGNLDEGEQWVTRALAITRRIGSSIYEAVCLYLLGRFSCQRGDYAKARELAQQGVKILRESESGLIFSGPIALGVLALATEDLQQRREILSEAETLLGVGSVGHNYLNFYEDAIEVCLQMEAWDDAERYAEALEEYTRAEPLPRSQFFIARARALASAKPGSNQQIDRVALKKLHNQASSIGLEAALPAIELVLSATE